MPAIRAGLLPFRAVVAILGLIPVGAGLAGILLGASMTGMPGPHPAATAPAAQAAQSAQAAQAVAALDSHVRYLSGLLLGIGLGFWSTLGDPRRHTARFRLLTAIVVIGGLGRLTGIVTHGVPPTPMALALVMELIVTPLLCLWQGRLAAAPPLSSTRP